MNARMIVVLSMVVFWICHCLFVFTLPSMLSEWAIAMNYDVPGFVILLYQAYAVLVLFAFPLTIPIIALPDGELRRWVGKVELE